MINYIQSNHDNIGLDADIFSDKFIENRFLKAKPPGEKYKIIENSCKKYNIKKSFFVTQIISHIIEKKTDKLTPELLSSLEYILHSNEVKEDYIIQYLLGELDKFL